MDEKVSYYSPVADASLNECWTHSVYRNMATKFIGSVIRHIQVYKRWNVDRLDENKCQRWIPACWPFPCSGSMLESLLNTFRVSQHMNQVHRQCYPTYSSVHNIECWSPCWKQVSALNSNLFIICLWWKHVGITVEHIPCIATHQPSSLAELSDIFKWAKHSMVIIILRWGVGGLRIIPLWWKHARINVKHIPHIAMSIKANNSAIRQMDITAWSFGLRGCWHETDFCVMVAINEMCAMPHVRCISSIHASFRHIITTHVCPHYLHVISHFCPWLAFFHYLSAHIMPKVRDSGPKPDIFEVTSTQTRRGKKIVHAPVKNSEPSPAPSRTASPSKKRALSPGDLDFDNDYDNNPTDQVPKRSRISGKVSI